jgi:hypothetical protein
VEKPLFKGDNPSHERNIDTAASMAVETPTFFRTFSPAGLAVQSPTADPFSGYPQFHRLYYYDYLLNFSPSGRQTLLTGPALRGTKKGGRMNAQSKNACFQKRHKAIRQRDPALPGAVKRAV